MEGEREPHCGLDYQRHKYCRMISRALEREKWTLDIGTDHVKRDSMAKRAFRETGGYQGDRMQSRRQEAIKETGGYQGDRRKSRRQEAIKETGGYQGDRKISMRQENIKETGGSQ